MVREIDVAVAGGRTLHAWDTGAAPHRSLTLMWHHGSPQTGALLPPLLAAADERDVRLVSYGRPGYGGSSPRPGRDVASAAADALAVATALDVGRFAVMGASGGGPHALACAALLPAQVVGAVSLAGLAPFTEELAWYTGMASDAALRAAAEGRVARARHAEVDEFDPGSFVAADHATLEAEWSALGEDVDRAAAAGDDALVDDDVAYVRPWGFDPADVSCPTLLVHGELDRVVPASHSRWLESRLPDVELWLRPADGHISVLRECPAAMDWLLGRVG